MTTKNFSTVAAEYIDAYQANAKRVIGNYRAGGEQVAEYVGKRFEAALAQSRPQLSEETVANARNTRKVCGRIYRQGVAATADTAELLVKGTIKVAGLVVDQLATAGDAKPTTAFRKARSKTA